VGELAPLVRSTLAAYYEEIGEQVHKWVEPLSSEDLWRRPYPYGNSVGHLILHLTGNLNHYIGKNIAGTSYVRNRPLEFTDPSKPPKDEVLANFDRAIDLVAATIRAEPADGFLKPYSDPTEPRSNTHFAVFLRMAAHAYHHVGQIVYLSKELSRS
jgi:uncharacterized damage-inducible protein DinB